VARAPPEVGDASSGGVFTAETPGWVDNDWGEGVCPYSLLYPCMFPEDQLGGYRDDGAGYAPF
jgi:hypothetical protein